MNLVIDTCVLIDLILANRDRHCDAVELYEILRSTETIIVVPFHAFFEISSAIKRHKNRDGAVFNKNFTFDAALKMHPVPIDKDFFERYFDVSLPYAKAGDLIFISLAKGEGLPLITEDVGMYKQAKEAGIAAFTIKEYVKSVKA